MKKVIIGALALIVIGGVVLATIPTDYVVVVADEIAGLEEDLLAIETAVNNGTLSPEQSVAARARIITRLDAIDAAVVASNTTELTEAQKQRLVAGLSRLKDTLLTYQATLITVEEVSKPVRRGGNNSSRTITEAVSETIASVEDHVEEVVENYAPELEEAPDAEETATSTEAVTDPESAPVSEDISEEPSTDEAVDESSADANDEIIEAVEIEVEATATSS